MSVARNLAEVRRRIEAAASRAGRRPSDITLIAVSKGKPASVVEEAIRAGVADLGESRVQETRERLVHLRDAATFHLIGHLQTNKAKFAVDLYDWIHSVDSERLCRALDDRAARKGRRLNVLVEVNTSGEESKHGVSPGRLKELLDVLGDCPTLQPRGLMTIGPRFGGDAGARRSFQELRELLPMLAERLPGEALHLSMGMSNDFEIAIEEGATMVRVGSAIFGAR